MKIKYSLFQHQPSKCRSAGSYKLITTPVTKIAGDREITANRLPYHDGTPQILSVVFLRINPTNLNCQRYEQNQVSNQNLILITYLLWYL